MSIQPSPPPSTNGQIDRLRYFRVTTFFARIILSIIFWDLLIGRIWLIGPSVKARRPQRSQRMARRFRFLAINMGGVLIKLGQFLSARIDVLPVEITKELAGLQDAVPPIPNAEIQQVIRMELGDPDRIFTRVESEPMAAASLGQTHRAWLPVAGQPEQNEAVVIKVQRPHIERTVRTDLAALRVIARWVMKYRPIRTRANVPALMEEFGRTLWEELDYRLEVNNAAQFATLFDQYDGLYVPRFYNDYCTERVLVIENVEGLKLTDLDEITAAGIDPKQVADRLLDVYYIQVFEKAFFHADPHPGNIFLRARPDRPHAEDEPQPFDLIFIDFGMMGRIPDEVNKLFKQVMVSVTTRDATGLTEAYDQLGFFLPGADLDRISEAQSVILDQ
ncbi:MAG TPA: AarF/ABC1/UbiB kinase family protein, partial [Anaerolineae bacterium]|nr:AarF/ABC1/UbiB kinase family protein [Anaerolineae bacterium]